MAKYTYIHTYIGLKNRYNKNRTADNWDAFRRQRNFCVKLSRKVKRDFYNQLDISEVTDNKKFGRLSNLLFRIRALHNHA